MVRDAGGWLMLRRRGAREILESVGVRGHLFGNTMSAEHGADGVGERGELLPFQIGHRPMWRTSNALPTRARQIIGADEGCRHGSAVELKDWAKLSSCSFGRGTGVPRRARFQAGLSLHTATATAGANRSYRSSRYLAHFEFGFDLFLKRLDGARGVLPFLLHYCGGCINAPPLDFVLSAASLQRIRSDAPAATGGILAAPVGILLFGASPCGARTEAIMSPAVPPLSGGSTRCSQPAGPRRGEPGGCEQHATEYAAPQPLPGDGTAP